MRSRTARLFLIVPAAALLVLAGCSSLNPPGTKAASSEATSGTAEQTSGTVQVTTPGGATTSLPGKEGETPAGLPSDIPLYTNGVKTGSVLNTPTGGKAYTVQMTTGDSVEAVVKNYRDALHGKGYTIKTVGTAKVKGEQRGFVTFSKGKVDGMVSVSGGSAQGGGITKITMQVILP